MERLNFRETLRRVTEENPEVGSRCPRCGSSADGPGKLAAARMEAGAVQLRHVWCPGPEGEEAGCLVSEARMFYVEHREAKRALTGVTNQSSSGMAIMRRKFTDQYGRWSCEELTSDETLVTTLEGVLLRHWMFSVKRLVKRSSNPSAEIVLSRVLEAIRQSGHDPVPTEQTLLTSLDAPQEEPTGVDIEIPF